jgi:phosphatidylinositol-3-phosphatase
MDPKRRNRKAYPLFVGLAVGVVALVLLYPGAGVLRNASAPAIAGPGGPSGPQAPGVLATHTFPSPIRHVFVVVLENAKRSTVMANGPYEESLTDSYFYNSHYYAVCHPSAPNYLAMTSGKSWQCGSDAYTTYNSSNIAGIVQRAGLTWNGFMESMPKPCDTSDSYPYAVRHDPFVYYKNIVGNRTYCNAHVVNFTAWTSDVSKGTIPNFAFFSPNLKDDGHDTGVAFADAWLKKWLPPLLNRSFANSSAWFIVYDESVNDNSGYDGLTGGNVYFAVVSPYSHLGLNISTNMSHYNLLSTIEWLLGVGSTGNNDGTTKFPALKVLFAFPKLPGPTTMLNPQAIGPRPISPSRPNPATLAARSPGPRV